jgi:hypothetical protein
VLEALDVRSVTAYRDRPYEWVAAIATFAADPADQANARIVDLSLAPRGRDAKVRFESDVRMLRPRDGGNGRALVVVPNRGMLGAMPFSLDVAPTYGPTEDPEAGDGFLLDQGWTIVWCGWQWDVLRHHGLLGLDAPLAEVEPGWMRIEFRLDAEQPDHRLSDTSLLFQFRDYPTAYPDDPDAFLTVRTTPLGEKQVVPRDAWRFADGARVTLQGGFQPFHWYELVYRAAIAPVVGAGLLAMRDMAAEVHRSHDHVLAFGISQSGRFLRQFLFDGLNRDESGRQVFDGVFTHIAGARRGEFNCRYGQPSLTHPLTPGYGPPYDTAALLERQRMLGGVPKLFSTNSSWEYWRGDGSLVHQDPRTGADLPEDPDSRTYLLAGTDHLGPYGLKDALPSANPVPHLDVTPLLRALFVDLEKWVCEDVDPPPSYVPRRSDGTSIRRDEVLRAFHDAVLPDVRHLPWTPEINSGATSWPLKLGEPMVALVSAVDPGGNEVAGIQLPAVAVPLAAYTGWNPRSAVEGLPDVLYEFLGSRLPLQSTAVVPDRERYEERVREAAGRLVTTRFLLQRDVEHVVAEAMRLYDEEQADNR